MSLVHHFNIGNFSASRTSGITPSSPELLLLPLSSAQSIADDATAEEALVWSATATKDTDSIWGGVSSSTITIPASWNGSYIQIIGSVRWQASNASSGRQIRMKYNSTIDPLYGGDSRLNTNSNSTMRQNINSGIIQCATNDTIELYVTQNSGGALNVLQDDLTWIAVVRLPITDLIHVDMTATGQSIAAATVDYVDFDNTVYDPNSAWDGTNFDLVLPDSDRWFFASGLGWDKDNTSAYYFHNLDYNSASMARGPATHRQFGLGNANFLPMHTFQSAGLTGTGDPGFQVQVKTGSIDTVGDGSYFQAFKLDDTTYPNTACLFPLDSVTAVTASTITALGIGTATYEDDADFTQAGDADAIFIPTGTWSFGLIFAGQPLNDNDVTKDCWHEVRRDTAGAGTYATFAGQCGDMFVMPNDGSGYCRSSMVGIIPDPTAGHRYRKQIWHNDVGSQNALAGNSAYFGVMLFE